jgi:very-short-patch-repair endonuclease
VRISANIERKVLYSELHKKLKEADRGTMPEVPFSHFLPTRRKFRADFLMPALKVIIEVNGGQFTGGRHTRGGKGYENDLTKLNLAQIHGYKVIQFTYQMLRRGEHVEILKTITG